MRNFIPQAAFSIFDPNTFMDQGTSEQGSTTAPIVDPGEYPGVIEKVNPKAITSKKDGAQYVVVEITWKLQAPEFEQAFKRPATVRQDFFPDFTESGALDMAKGKNVTLNRIREAVGLNKPGQAFKWGMLVGAGPAKIMVYHETRKGTTDVADARVRSVGKM